MATYVYVDGFNLYYQVRAKGFKWLDLKALAEEVLPNPPDISSIKYFTARVSGAWDAGAPGRQQVYLNALRTIPEVEIYFGEFLAKPAWRPILNLPVGGHDILCSPQAQVSRGVHRVPAENQTLEVWNYPPIGKCQVRQNHCELGGGSEQLGTNNEQRIPSLPGRLTGKPAHPSAISLLTTLADDAPKPGP